MPQDHDTPTPAQLRFEAARRLERDNELAALGQRSGQVTPFSSPLADYLLQRTVERRRIDGPVLATLRSGDETVNETRAALFVGRGNVTTDIAATNRGSSVCTEVARQLHAQFLPNNGNVPLVFGMHAAASALQTKAGNCGEFGHLATMMHLTRLQPGQSVHKVRSTSVDHGWSELRTGPAAAPTDVIMDGWGNGPAVLREDAAFARNAASVASEYNASHVMAPVVRAHFDHTAAAMANSPVVQQQVGQQVFAGLVNGFAYPPSATFGPTSVQSIEFRTRRQGMFNSQMNTETATVPSPLNRQVLVAGAVRDAGANVRTATASTPHNYR